VPPHPLPCPGSNSGPTHWSGTQLHASHPGLRLASQGSPVFFPQVKITFFPYNQESPPSHLPPAPSLGKTGSAETALPAWHLGLWPTSSQAGTACSQRYPPRALCTDTSDQCSPGPSPYCPWSPVSNGDLKTMALWGSAETSELTSRIHGNPRYLLPARGAGPALAVAGDARGKAASATSPLGAPGE
jgi:hypothetical protein